jgi:hypothetical protein
MCLILQEDGQPKADPKAGAESGATWRIVGFEVEPFTIQHERKVGSGIGDFVTASSLIFISSLSRTTANRGPRKTLRRAKSPSLARRRYVA